MKMPKSAFIKTFDSDSSTFSSSTSSPSVSSNDQLELVRPKISPILCKICGDIAQGHHFGGYSCHACGAFFRRSVSNQQQYLCAKNQSCNVGKGHTRGMCKACRFKRCIDENMKIQAIIVRPTDDLRCFDSATLLKQIYLAQRATFVNRYAFSLKFCHGNKSLIRMNIENPMYKDVERAMLIEFHVLQKFLCESGFVSYGLTLMDIKYLAVALFGAWICFQSIIITLKNGGHKRGITYFVEESHMNVDRQTLHNYVSSFENLMDYDLAAKHSYTYYADVLKSCERISQLRTEDYENAALFKFFALKTASTMFPKRRENLREKMNFIFDDLKKQYVQSYDNIALRMGNLILVLTELENAANSAKEYITLLHLNGYNSIMPSLVKS